ncbi:hypothetical protein FQN50_008347 [Emmonsiellopsis sp. PD_5]|nr:hypothetical protein FQN50_008347 [Emmonsiellopsis sp. PD_5]
MEKKCQENDNIQTSRQHPSSHCFCAADISHTAAPFALMRGIGFRTEAATSPFVCPSCLRRLAGDVSLRRPSAPHHRNRYRYISQSSNPPVPQPHTPWVFHDPPLLTRWNFDSYGGTRKEIDPSQIGPFNSPLRESLDTRRWTLVDKTRRKASGKFKSRTASVLDSFEAEDDLLHQFFGESPDMAAYAFLGPEKTQASTYSLPETHFAEAFSLLSPSHFIEPYKKLHRRFHPAVAHWKGYKTLEVIFDQFKRMLYAAVRKRRSASFTLGIAEYTHLLDCARSMGDAELADSIWADMQVDGIQPTLECYNHYMEAKVWHHAYVSKERYNLRFSPWVYYKRSQPNPEPGFQGFRTGPGGVRDEIYQDLEDMNSKGLQPDVTTFINVMTASAREGHIVAVENILKKVWNIDVAALSQGDPSAVPPVSQIDRSSSLYPTTNLLFAIAHIFGSNNDLATALQLVDFVSREYNIEISPAVWNELFEWSFVLSCKKWGTKANQRNPIRISRSTVEQLFYTLTRPPHNMKPTMEMYDFLVKSAWDRRDLQALLTYMRSGRALFHETLERRNQAREHYVRFILQFIPPWMQIKAPKIKPYLRMAPGPRKYYLIDSSPGDSEIDQKAIEQSIDETMLSSLIRDDKYRRQDCIAQATGEIQPYLKSQWASTQLKRLQFRKDASKLLETPSAKSSALSGNLSFETIRQYRTMKSNLNLEQLNTSRDATIIEGWCRLMFCAQRRSPRYQRCFVPSLVQEWKRYLPENTFYRTSTGRIEFEPNSFWPTGRKDRPENGFRSPHHGWGGVFLNPEPAPKPFTSVFKIIGAWQPDHLNEGADIEWKSLYAAGQG